jgi:hypothetical protein
VRKFIERPEKFIEEFLRKEKCSNHFIETDIKSIRISIKQLIIRLKNEQDAAEILAGDNQSV